MDFGLVGASLGSSAAARIKNESLMQSPNVNTGPTESVPYVAMPAPPQGIGSTTSLLAVMWRRKGILIFLLLCGLGGGYYYYTQQPEQFTSTALVEVYRQQVQTSTGSAIEKVQDLAPTIVFIDAEIKSDKVLKKANEIGRLSAFSGFPSEESLAVSTLRINLKVTPPFEKGSEATDRSLVQISYSCGDPRLCAAVVDSVVQAYEQYVNGRHRDAIETVKGFFKEARDSILPQANTLEEEYTKFRGEAPLEWNASGEAINPYRQDVIRLEDSIDRLEGDTKKLTTKLRLIEETSKANTSAVTVLREVQYLLDDLADISALQQALTEGTDAEIEIQQTLVPLIIQADLLRSQFGANHPSLATIEEKITATRKALTDLNRTKEERREATDQAEARREEGAKALLRSYVNGLQKKRLLIDEEMQSLSQRLEEVKQRAHKIIVFENENSSYMRRISRYQDMLDSFDTQLEKASLPLLNPGLQVNELLPAVLGYKVGPELAKSLLLGGMLGLALGGLLAWLIDWSERTFRSPDEIADTLGLPILTHMPLMLVKAKKKGKEGETGPLDRIDRVVSVVHDPHAPGSESIRSMRTALFANPTKTAEYQIIQVTSALPGDGKSTVAANFAASVARASKKVLIIDADLRRPTQSKIFGIQSELGVTSVLNGECDCKDAIQETAVEGLYVMPTGPKPSNPAEALMLPEFGQMLDDLRPEFDMIIIDTPPLLAVTDASNVASQVDGVMFVMRIGRNSKPMAKRAVTILRNLHVNVIGVIVNAIGDSGYSATYATAWSNYYGGRPGGEFGYGYYQNGYRYGYSYSSNYGSEKYLNASRGQRVVVKGRRAGEGPVDSRATDSANVQVIDKGTETET